MYDAATMILLIIGATAGVISALPVLGVNVQVFGRKTMNTGEIPAAYSNSDKWRAWFAIVFSSLALLGVGISIYYHAKPRIVEKTVVQAAPMDVKLPLKPITETIHDRAYLNETLEIDGKAFNHCRFENVTFMYHGLGESVLSNPTYIGFIAVETDNKAVLGFQGFVTSLSNTTGMITKGFFLKDENGNLVPVPNKNQNLPAKKK